MADLVPRSLDWIDEAPIHIEARATSTAAPDAVFAVLADHERWPEWFPNVRSVEEGDQVLFNPEDRYEVEVQGEDLIILRERDIHAVAAPRLAEGSTGLYL